MTVQQVIDMSVQGELKNLNVKSDTPAIINFINLGMIELYKRFALQVEEYVIELEDGVEIYEMPSNFLWAIAAYGEVHDTSDDKVNILSINEEDDPLGINTISYNKIQVPLSIYGAFISIIYRASPEFITIDNLEDNIKLPLQLLEPLLHYIGYRAHNAVTGKINSEYTTHYTLFEQACARIEKDGMFTSDGVYMSSRIEDRGFY